jgi:prepilin-type N-terminal cleavage/methylation domain-containing protein
MKRKKHFAFTLVELLVVIAIIGILIAMLMPAIQSARETARRAECTNNMMQLGMALSDYQSAHQSLPPGTIAEHGPVQNVAKGNHISWLVQILPYIQERNTYKNIDLSAGAYAPQNAVVRRLSISLFKCPSYVGQENPETPLSNYAGCQNGVEAPIDENNNGVLFLNSHIRDKDITDGASNTIFAGEKCGSQWDLGWMSGTRATLRNCGTPLGETVLDDGPRRYAPEPGKKLPAPPAVTDKPAAPEETAEAGKQVDAEQEAETEQKSEAEKKAEMEKKAEDEKIAKEKMKELQAKIGSTLYVGGFGSYHPYGTNFVFGDGAVHFTRNDIDLKLLEQLGDRADGKLLEGGPTRGQQQ